MEFAEKPAMLKPYEDTQDRRIGVPLLKLWQTTAKGGISFHIRHIEDGKFEKRLS